MQRMTLCVLVMVLALAGCAAPKGSLGVLTYPHVAMANKTETVLVATTRAKSDNESEFFSRARSQHLNFAEIIVSIPQKHEPGHLEKVSDHHDPRQHFTTAQRRHVAGRNRFVARLNQAILQSPKPGREVFVFVHGYNNTFAEGLFRTAQIRHDFELPAAVTVHYSWPSAGKANLYAYDRDSANFARDGLVGLLDILARSKARRIFLVGHSMGGLVTMEALRQITLTGKRRIITKLSLVALASPDIDADVFKKQMDALPARRPQMVVLVAKDDRALRLSGILRGGHPRIGQGKNVKQLTELGITVIDLSSLGDGDALSHTKFSSSPSFIEMIRKRRITDQTLRSADNRARKTARGADALAIGDVILHLPSSILSGR